MERPAELRKIAEELAYEAGQLALVHRASGTLETSSKSSAEDIVTTADKACERQIISGLKAIRPDDGYIGEEGSQTLGISPVTWHVDPIDGTVNYVYGLDFAVSIAAAEGDQLVAGAVYCPLTDEMFSAGKNEGSTLNGHEIKCSEQDTLATSLLATGFSYDSQLRASQATALVHIISLVRDIRRGGSAAIDLCRTASGRIDGYFELDGLNSWDVAAGTLIAAEAGAITTTFNPRHSPRENLITAASPGIADSLSDAISKALLKVECFNQ